MEKKQQGNIFAIVIMFFLFAMISFVTGFQNPFGVIERLNGIANGRWNIERLQNRGALGTSIS